MLWMWGASAVGRIAVIQNYTIKKLLLGLQTKMVAETGNKYLDSAIK